ncbi:MAG: transcription elongation factor GreA [Candidatus Hydrogenedentes bacterium]|jgi:transcription elongation factor GreA|nr:transcription elongation factor GreA [Candidatus Hydrogenedentota bacterium]
MANDTLYMTPDGLEKMKAELEALYVRRKAVVQTIEYARGLGDLKENAEYHAAKEEQALVHAKINDLESKISRAAIMDSLERDTSKAFLGATVQIFNMTTQSESTLHLVDSAEADILQGKMSVQSPVGKALLGKSVGDEVVIQVPAGQMIMKLVAISYD